MCYSRKVTKETRAISCDNVGVNGAHISNLNPPTLAAVTLERCLGQRCHFAQSSPLPGIVSASPAAVASSSD